jgi:hypothetical protein
MAPLWGKCAITATIAPLWSRRTITTTGASIRSW